MAKQRNSLGACVLQCDPILNESISFEDYKKQYKVDLDEIFDLNGFKSSFTKILFVDTTNIQGAVSGALPILVPVSGIRRDFHQEEYPSSYAIFIKPQTYIQDGALVETAEYALIIDYTNRQIVTWEE